MKSILLRKRLLLAAGFLLSLSATQAQNRAATFDGVDDYIDCGAAPALATTNIKTMECWAKFNSFTGAQEIISKSTGGQGMELLLFGSDIRVYVMSGANYSFISHPVSG